MLCFSRVNRGGCTRLGLQESNLSCAGGDQEQARPHLTPGFPVPYLTEYLLL